MSLDCKCSGLPAGVALQPWQTIFRKPDRQHIETAQGVIKWRDAMPAPFDAHLIADAVCACLASEDGVQECVQVGDSCCLRITLTENVRGHELLRQCGGSVAVRIDPLNLSNAEAAMKMLNQALDKEVGSLLYICT